MCKAYRSSWDNIEPYPKSLALELHDDSICVDDPEINSKVQFLPYVGISPSKYFNFFTMVDRKQKDGSKIQWHKDKSNPRFVEPYWAYMAKETKIVSSLNDILLEQKLLEESTKIPGGDTK
jgi:hypothetical protein